MVKERREGDIYSGIICLDCQSDVTQVVDIMFDVSSLMRMRSVILEGFVSFSRWVYPVV